MSAPATAAPARILIADDDPSLCLLLSNYLGQNGYTVQAVQSAEAALQLLRTETGLPDLLVLDVMLPGMDGLTALRHVRERSAMPVLMLSSRGEPVDRVVGLELGADDYLTKPCLPRELLARIQALLRRARPAEPGNEIRLGCLRLIPAQRRALSNGTALELTGAEFSVLLELVRHPGSVISREQLTERGLNRPLERFDRAIDVHVSRLRNKLAAASVALSIESVRGAGYVLQQEDVA